MRATVDLIIRDLFTDLQAINLNDSQTALVKSMKKSFARNKTLSEKQLSILFELRKYGAKNE